jgi:D-alanine--poly(phosphoribitol) ligase subunit 1
MDESGLLFCRGRMDDQIKLNGYRMELTEIDAALSALPGVHGGACAALRRPDGTVARLVGFVDIEGKPGELPESLADWKNKLGLHLPAYMIPSELMRCDAMPMSNNHKIDRKKLIEIYTQASA